LIPNFLPNGFLPEGIHEATFAEVQQKLGFSRKREQLLNKMKYLIEICQLMGCDVIYLDGSFVSAKIAPNDYDACWDCTKNKKQVMSKVCESYLNADSETQKDFFGGEIYPAFAKAPLNEDISILTYFQRVQFCNEHKGIIKIRL